MLYSFSGSVAVPQHKNAVEMKNDPHFWHLKHSGRIESFLEYALPLYVKEGKSQLMIAIGCTGGKHRSITFARKIGEYCTKLGYQPSVQHRDARRTA